jgi:hypothetical protein
MVSLRNSPHVLFDSIAHSLIGQVLVMRLKSPHDGSPQFDKDIKIASAFISTLHFISILGRYSHHHQIGICSNCTDLQIVRSLH